MDRLPLVEVVLPGGDEVEAIAVVLVVADHGEGRQSSSRARNCESSSPMHQSSDPRPPWPSWLRDTTALFGPLVGRVGWVPKTCYQ